MARRKSTFDIVIRCLFFFILGAGTLLYSHISYLKYNDTEELRNRCVMKVDAPITKVDIIEETERDEDGREYTVGEHYKVFFTFKVDGKEYSSDYIDTKEHKVGDTFPLYCNPDDPHEWIARTDVNMQDDRLQNVLGFKMIGIALIGLGVLSVMITVIKSILKKR